MPWLRWINLFAGRAPRSLVPNMTITLVTLRVVAEAMSEEVAFYCHAEYEAILEWARMGHFILALAATDRDELTLVCVQTPEEMRLLIDDLPLVTAGLATFDIRSAMALRMDDEGPGQSH